MERLDHRDRRDRRELERWFKENPPESRVEIAELLDSCERAVRRHAREDAWLAAKDYALGRAAQWERDWTPPASEHFVTSEVCHELAWELAQHEPTVEAGSEEHLAGGPVHEALTPEAWEKIRAWVLELASAEEHATWGEIVRYTDHRARDIIREQGFTRNVSWSPDHRYSAIAAHVARILARDYSVRAHPR